MSNTLNSICVFCGSSFGKNALYKDEVKALGKHMATNNIKLIYGGGNVGLMGELARSVLEHNGKVTGVIPQKIYDNVEHIDLPELHVVEGMHQRKAKMYELSDGFIALPGGIGTIEELAEIFTWYQLGYHAKPIGVLNIHNYFGHFFDLLKHMVSEGFLKEEHQNILMINECPELLINKMSNHKSLIIDKWIK